MQFCGRQDSLIRPFDQQGQETRGGSFFNPRAKLSKEGYGSSHANIREGRPFILTFHQNGPETHGFSPFHAN